MMPNLLKLHNVSEQRLKANSKELYLIFSYIVLKMERGTPMWSSPHDYGVSRILFSSEKLLHH